MSMQQIIPNIIGKMNRRCRIGWFDHCSDSWDMRVANARAYRIYMRFRGQRMTLREAMK